MGNEIKAFGVNRLTAALFFVVSAALVALIFVPGAIDWIAYAEMHGKLSFFNGWEPRHRLFAGFTLVAVFALTAVVYLRLLIDNRMVFLGTEGIEVKHPLGTQRALWRDMVEIKRSKLVSNAHTLLFQPGRDSRGRKRARKVRLSAPLLGVDIKGVLVEVTVHYAMKEMAVAGIRPPADIARSTIRDIGNRYIPEPSARTFGKRR